MNATSLPTSVCSTPVHPTMDLPLTSDGFVDLTALLARMDNATVMEPCIGWGPRNPAPFVNSCEA